MKNLKKTYFAFIILLFACVGSAIAQNITFSGPPGVSSIASGTILALKAEGQTAQKYISNVPTFGYSNYYNTSINADVTCDLWETDYTNGIFKWRFRNLGTVPKKIKFLFVNVRITSVSSNAVYSHENVNLEFEITVQPEPPVKVPIYLISYKNTDNANDTYLLSSNGNLPNGWHNSGITFKAFINPNAVAMLGAVPIYQHKYKVYDGTGNLADPMEMYIYSTSSSLSQAATPSYSYQLESSNVVFYAFSSQASNTVSILQCRHSSVPPIVIYRSADSDISDMYETSHAFYAYRWDQQ